MLLGCIGDDFTGSSDLANTLASRQRIRDTAARGLAILLISTDLEELLSMCDRIAVIAEQHAGKAGQAAVFADPSFGFCKGFKRFSALAHFGLGLSGARLYHSFLRHHRNGGTPGHQQG